MVISCEQLIFALYLAVAVVLLLVLLTCVSVLAWLGPAVVGLLWRG